MKLRKELLAEGSSQEARA
jgi:hypothetical protein